MKIRHYLLALIATSLLTPVTFADGPFDKFLPRGRLLKKLRDDVMGTPEAKEPTPAQRPAKTGQKGPTPATRPNVPQRTNALPRTNGQSATNRNAQSQFGQPNRSNQPTRPTSVTNGANGFGMAVVADKNDNVVVTQVAANGNAAEAGLQRGDVIVEAGGVELSAIEEFREIAKMLGAGDQLELKVARRGRPSEVMLQYGQPPSLDDVEVGDVSADSDRANNATIGNRNRQRYQNDFSFVPPADDDSRRGMQSVVERSNVPARQTSTQQRAYRSAPGQNQTVTQQQRQIQMLQQQLEQLRRQQNLTGSGLRAQ